MSGFRSFQLSLSTGRAMPGAALALCALLTACGGGSGSHTPHPAPPVQPSPPSSPPPVNQGPLYDFTELGLPGNTGGVIVRQGIANGGLVTGSSWDAAGNVRAFLYNGKTNIDLGTFGGANARAFAINRCGQVAGWAATSSGFPHAFFYDGTLHDLGTLSGGAESWGLSISTCGKVAGFSGTGAGQQHAFYYDGKTMRDIDPYLGQLSGANDVNAVGQVVGYVSVPGSEGLHAFLYDARTGAPLQDLNPPGRTSQAIDINEAGQVVMGTHDADNNLRAFRYSGGALQDLGTLAGTQGSEPHAINEAGHVVGYCYYPGGQVAFVHDGTSMRSLGTLNGGRFSDANAINASGLIVGQAVDGNTGPEHAVAWGPDYGLVDLNTRVKDLPAGVVLLEAEAVADDGAIAVRTNTGLGLLRPRKDGGK